MQTTLQCFKEKRLYLLIFMGILLAGTVYAQSNTVRGTIKDENGQAMPGVSVLVKGTSHGTATDSEGKYTIEAAGDAILAFSFIGYTTEEIAVEGRNVVDIMMVPDIQALSEVVVVGYGEQKKETLTGAVTQVGSEVFKDRPVSNAALALQGQVPGLVITRTTSRPGNENLNIRVRGESSVNAVDPLIIVDGIPVIGTWELNQINPNDIESVSVLKDASAAIYGARAAGGVILVTTKRGKGDKMQINYNGNVRINTIGITTPYANMSQWATQYLLAAQQDQINPVTGVVTEWYPQWTKENLQRMTKGESFEYTNPAGKVYKYADNNYFDDLYGNSVSQQHNISLRGSANRTSYMASVGYANNKSLLKTAYDGEKKYNIRLNYDYKFSDRVKIETGMSYDDRTVESPKNGIGTGYFDAPIFPTYNSKGDYYDDYSGQRNPVSLTKEGGRIINEESIIRFNAKLTVELMEGLSLSGNASVVKRNGWKTSYNQHYQNWDWLGTKVTGDMYTNPEIIENIGNTLYKNLGAFINYNKTINSDHNISFMGGLTGELNEAKDVEAKRTKLEYNGLYPLNTANTTTQTNAGSASHWGLISWVGRFNYDYQGKYLLELLGRRDGSSKFHPDHRWSNFGGVSAGWRASEEEFIRNLNIFNNLKLRVAYGETGGQSGIGNYDYVSAITTTGTALFGDTRALQQTAYLSGMTSLTRTWERISNTNIGVDFSVLSNRLSGSFDVFQKKNKGMLTDIVYSQLLGATAPKTNSGTLRVNGWDLGVNWKDEAGGVKYQIGLQVSDTRTKITSLEGTNIAGQGKIATREGYAMNSIFVYRTDGYFKDREDVSEYYSAYGNKGNLSTVLETSATARLRPGDLKVVDRDGSNTIDVNDTYNYGDSNPHYTFGVNLGLQWKGFDFSAFFQGVGHQYLLRTGNARAPFFRNYLNINTAYIGKTWTPDNTSAEYPRMSFDNNKNNWNWQYNDVNVQNLAYVRMKSLIIGYTLPRAITDRGKLSNVRVYFSGGDLFEFTTIKDGFDPEFQESSDSNYPFLRTYSFGLDVTF